MNKGDIYEREGKRREIIAVIGPHVFWRPGEGKFNYCAKLATWKRWAKQAKCVFRCETTKT